MIVHLLVKCTVGVVVNMVNRIRHLFEINTEDFSKILLLLEGIWELISHHLINEAIGPEDIFTVDDIHE